MAAKVMLMEKKPRILFIYTSMHSTFRTDIEILKRSFEVETFQYSGKKDIFRLLKAIYRTDINMSRFVLGHATLAVLLSKFLRRKSIVVAEGWDVINMSEIGYGAMISKSMARKTKFALKHADAVIAVSEAIKNDAMKYVKRDINLVYHCVDGEKFKPKGEKEPIAITVGNIRKDTLLRKGLKAFVESAKYLPDIKFILIGKPLDDTADELKKISTSNVMFTGFIPDEKLMEYYQKAKVYVQVSAHEGFGLSMAEAMLCECVPVVTRRGAIPEVVGDSGFYVPFADPRSTAGAIEKALKSDFGRNARERIINNFPVENRERKLKALILDLIDN